MGDIFHRSQLYLLVLYVVLTLSVGFQIARILYYRHALYSFQLGFLLLCFIWGVLRVVFWSIEYIFWGAFAEVLLWVPLNFQFATFSLLVVFYAHLVHKSTWEKYMKKRFTIAYIVINVVLLALQCVWLGFVNSDIQHSDEDWASGVQSAIAALVFVILVAILAWYGYSLHKVIRSTTKHQMLYQVPSNIFVVTFMIVLLFLSRCIFDFMNTAGKWEVDIDDEHVGSQLVVFFAYFLWEIVPTVTIVLLFWRIPTTHIGGLTRRGKTTMFMLPPPDKVPVSRLFNDPQRYDSDDETTGFLRKGSPASYTPSSYTIGKNAPYSTTPQRSVPHSLESNNGLQSVVTPDNINDNNNALIASSIIT